MPIPSFSASKSPFAWEKAWQAEVDRRFSKHRPVSQTPLITNLDNAAGLPVNEEFITCAMTNHDQICTLQQDLLKLASDKCATDNFEERWRSAGNAVRTKHYFDAMRRACEIPDMECQRGFAPEVSLKQFEAKDGQGYLDLMQLLMPRRNLPNQYVRIEHPVVDVMLGLEAPFDTARPVGTDRAVLMRKVLDIRRCMFTTLVVWNILLSFYGLSEEVVNVKTSAKSDSKGAREFVKALGHESLTKEQVRVIAKETKQLQKEEGHWMCAYCKKFEFQVTEALKACAKCKTIGRNVMYCSRDCQKNDWKRGNPPHKTTCGEPTSSVPTAQSLPVPEASLPSQASTFRPPPALLHQISLLEENPKVDYVLVRPAPLPDCGIALQDPLAQVSFRLMRERAFETGDPSVVRAMYKQLSQFAKAQVQYGIEDLEKQLKIEFGVDVKA